MRAKMSVINEPMDFISWMHRRKLTHDKIMERIDDDWKRFEQVKALKRELEAAQQHLAAKDDEIERLQSKEYASDIATKFFFWWWNQQGANTMQAFDEWWERVAQQAPADKE